MVEPSPFPFQGPLAPGEVTGRTELRRELAERLTDHRVTAMLGPRRYGKTSILRQVAADLAEVGPETIWVDLYAMSSMADVAGAFDRGLAATRGPLRNALDAAAATVSISLGTIGVQLSQRARDRPDPALMLRSLLQLLVRMAQRRPLILVMDEFSGITTVEQAAGILRTELQHHYRDLGIVFAGSQPSTMRMLFTDQAQPFFAQADLIEIGPLTDAEVTAIIIDGFERTGRDPGPVVGPIVDLSRGHPQRTMQLADAVWRRVEPGEAATDRTWEDALAATRTMADHGWERLFTLLPTGHQKVLRIIASGGSVHGTAADVIGLAPGTAQAGLTSLLGSGELMKRDDKTEIVDPLLADWLRRRFAT